jgi:1,4-dihydroxy-2-naphthoate octaprenyltransferase
VYAITQTIDVEAWLAASVVGLLACALLVINNLRDIPGDTQANKKTLAVRIGDRKTRQLFYAMFVLVAVMIAVVGIGDRSVLIAMLGLVSVVPAVKVVAAGAKGRELISVLGATGKAQLVVGLLLAVGLAI